MNINKMMQNLQKMQGQLQEQIDAIEVEASAGGGMVIARMNGKKELVGITIGAEAASPDDLELLQDLVWVVLINHIQLLVLHQVQQTNLFMQYIVVQILQYQVTLEY